MSLNFKEISYNLHSSTLQKYGFKRTHTLEIISAVLGFKSYSALRSSDIFSEESLLSDKALFCNSDPTNLKERLIGLAPDSDIDIDQVESQVSTYIMAKFPLVFIKSEHELKELIESLKHLHEEITDSVENAVQSEMAGTNFDFEDWELCTTSITIKPDEINVELYYERSGHQFREAMLSTGPNNFSLNSTVRVPLLGGSVYGEPEILNTEWNSHSSFYDEEQV